MLRLRKHLIANKLEFSILLRTDRHLMGKQAVGFQIGGKDLYGNGDRPVFIYCVGNSLRLHGIFLQGKTQFGVRRTT